MQQLKKERMKKYINLLIISVILFSSCKEDYIGQFPIDGVAPLQITNVLVTNLPGTVKLKYQLPDEPDLLYVKAIYKNSAGEVKEVRASVFSNLMEIQGFGRSRKDTIQLISVDRSQNESAPVKIVIKPLDSPIYSILDSMVIAETFGGVKFRTVNPQKIQIIANIVLEKTVDGKLISQTDAFYFNSPVFKGGIRGLDSIPYNISLVLHDVYGNVTDTLRTTKKPLYEIKLPTKKEFKEMPMSSMYLISNWTSPWSCLWDGITTTDVSFYLDITNPPFPYFTFDMGRSYILSRMKMWQRQKYMYVLHNPRFFEIWGTNDLVSAQNADSFDGWKLLSSFQGKKPSGNDDNATITADDKAWATAGEEFEFENMETPVRFIRFRSIQNWTKTNALHISELEFYGIEKK